VLAGFSRSDAMFIFGILTVACMLGSYGLARSSYAALAFAIAWTVGSVLLLAAGVWPIAAIQAIFACIAFGRHWKRRACRGLSRDRQSE